MIVAMDAQQTACHRWPAASACVEPVFELSCGFSPRFR